MMNNESIQLNSVVSEDDVLRKIFLDSLSSSPTISSSSSLSQSSTSIDVSIDTCIEYLRKNATQELPNHVLDRFRTYMEQCTPNGRIDWKSFKEASERWINSINPEFQDKNNNFGKIKRDETMDSPDESTTTDEGNFNNQSDDSENLSEFIEWSIVPMQNMVNDSISDFEKSNMSVKSPKDIISSALCGAELRHRLRRFDEDNVWLREELTRTEELATNYRSQFHSVRQKFDRIKEKYNQLERENEEQKEVIASMEVQEKQCQVALEKSKKEHKSYVKEVEISKKLITTLKAKIDKLTNSKLDYATQLSTVKMRLEEKEINCEVLQEQLDEMSNLNKSLEDYYEDTIRGLQDRNEELKCENIRLKSKFNTDSSPTEINFLQSTHRNPSIENTEDEETRILSANSLFDELKATGYLLNESQDNTRITELEEKINLYNEEIYKAIKQVNIIMQLLIQGKKLASVNEECLEDTCDLESKYITLLAEKISILSKAVAEIIHKPNSLTSNASCQVFAEPLEIRQLDELDILSFKNNKDDNFDILQQSSSDSGKAFFVAPSNTFKQENVQVISSRSIYTHKTRSNNRRWGQKFDELNVVSSEDDDSINGNSSLLPHSTNSELESKINLRRSTTVVVDDTVVEENDKIAVDSSSPIRKNLSQEFFYQNISHSRLSSPIFTTSKTMSEKNIPRRKYSVFARTIDMDKMINSHECENQLLTSTSTPAPQIQTFTSSSYRTAMNSSDSSSLSVSSSNTNLDTSNEDGKIHCHDLIPEIVRQESLVLAPAKLTWPIEEEPQNGVGLNKIIESNDSLTQLQDMSNSVGDDLFKNSLINDTKMCANSTINSDTKGDEPTMKFPKLNVTWTVKSLKPNSLYQRPTSDCDDCAASEKATVKLPAVMLAMSSSEDSSDSSDSEQVIVTCSNKQLIHETNNNKTTQDLCHISDRIQSTIEDDKLSLSDYAENNVPNVTKEINDTTFTYKSSSNIHEGVLTMKRSRSESESLGYHLSNYSLKKPKSNSELQAISFVAFPSLTNSHLNESGIANLIDSVEEHQEKNLSESDIEKKYIAFSLGLSTDRLTLSRRRVFSRRQRDQMERNLAGEISRMTHNIEELAPLCFDSETINRIERARNQIEIIAQCAHKVSWAAELLGAVQQEHRISRAIYLADKYHRTLRNRCEKLEADLAETKQILSENNIVLDETNFEAGEELTTIRFRSGLPSTANRTMVARRRASIATIFRPLTAVNNADNNTKEGVRQRNSVSGRVTTVRRPSFNADSQRWEIEKLTRTESSNSVGELREIFEHYESRRGSKEEINNIRQVTQVAGTNSSEMISPLAQTTVSKPYNIDGELLPTTTEINEEETQSHIRTMLRIPSFTTGNYMMSWRSVLLCIIISFLIGFYIKDIVVSSRSCNGAPFRWWTLEELLDRYVEKKSSTSLPI